MPFLWIGISSLAGIVTGLMYEKETTKKVVEAVKSDTSSGVSFSWWDKTLMAAAGVAAYYIYKKVR